MTHAAEGIAQACVTVARAGVMRAHAVIVLALWAALAAAGATTVQVTTNVVLAQAKRIGINVGPTDSGASQHLRNFFENPGFEPGHFGMAALAETGCTSRLFLEKYTSASWAKAHPTGFWTGADYEIVYGAAKGRTGVVSAFQHVDGKYAFDLGANGTTPGEFSVMFVRREVPGVRGAPALADRAMARPGSPGVQALHVTNGYVYTRYTDSHWRDNPEAFTNSGKFLVLDGTWRLSLWARGKANGDRIQFRFYREGEFDVFNKTIVLSQQWQFFEFQTVLPPGTDNPNPYPPGQYHPIVVTTLSGMQGEAWVDDLQLVRVNDRNPTVFSDRFVQRLLELRPGVLRHWGGHLGTSLADQLAPICARRTHQYFTDNYEPTGFAFSLHEFLELCVLVGAEPWYILPITFSPEELRGLIEYLSAPADGAHPWACRRAALGQFAPWTEVFKTIHLEFGNEIWSSGSATSPFRGACVNGGVREGQVANARLATLKSSPFYDPARFNLIIGGQSSVPSRQTELEQNCTNHDELAVASYFSSTSLYGTDEQLFQPPYAWPTWQITSGNHSQSWARIRGFNRGTTWATYEGNFGEGGGSAPDVIQNELFAGQAGGIAVGAHFLVNQRFLGAQHQCVFTALQYSYRDDDGKRVKIWGALRDVAATGRKRPTWLSAELANRAIGGDMVATSQSGDNPTWQQTAFNGIQSATTVRYIQSFAYCASNRYSAVLFNLMLTNAHAIVLESPVAPYGTAMLYRLAAPSLRANNETNLQVVITDAVLSSFSNRYLLELPPHSMSVVQWLAAGAPPPPTQLAATGSAGAVQLTWTADGSATHGYELERAPDVAGVPGVWAPCAAIAPAAVSYSDTNVIAGCAYWYQLRARNAGGESWPSEQVTAAVPRGAPPAPPAGLAAAARSGVRIDVTWQPVDGDVQNYMLECATETAGVPGPFYTIASPPASITSNAVGNLTAQTTYHFRLRAVNPSGTSDVSGVVQATTLSAIGTPHALAPAGVTDVPLDAMLSSSPFESSAGTTHKASSWHVSRTNTFSPLVWYSNNTLYHKTNVIVPGDFLQWGTRYWWRVQYRDSQDAVSEWSEPVWFETVVPEPGMLAGLLLAGLALARRGH